MLPMVAQCGAVPDETKGHKQMAWQFVGFMTHPEIHGPLPRKRWRALASCGVAYRMRRKHSTKVTKARRGGKEAYEATAREYCRWLAARDGIALPSDFRETVVWEGKHIMGV